MKNNVLVVHGGGPTAVMNASLYGVLVEAKKQKQVGTVYGAMGGMEGVINGDFLNLSQYEEDKLRLLLQTPGSALGSSRYPVSEKEYDRIPSILQKYNIGYLLPNGGNGTMDTCGKIYKSCLKQGVDIKVVGIPKTMDNDIAVTDHTPGYGSAARYIAGTVKEIGEDVRSLPIHISVVETFGRNAGWLAASSALAREKKGDAPHLIYLPERPFDEEQFLKDVKRIYEEKGYAVVVASEGLKRKDGSLLVEPVFQTERAIYYGDVSAYLSKLIIQKLGIKARNEKTGLSSRASIAWQSSVDRKEAQLVGEYALKLALAGKNGIMVGMEREINENQTYQIKLIEIPIEDVMLWEKPVPDNYINAQGNDVTEEFITWCRPLIGEQLPTFLRW